mmetsp:Transcript_16560/g.51538  ORF Transcript_16560/g.51538 Transcript_16560/m.51538 type:complete len:242 (+) Transcript_16560:477-1202(+)
MASLDDRSRSRSPERPVSPPPGPPPPPRRFRRGDRVVCQIGGKVGWAPGTINAVDELNPSDPTEVLPYVVKVDPPVGRLIIVPFDANAVCRAEICFGESVSGGEGMAVRCAPAREPKRPRRFAVGDRVAVAVEDPSDNFTDWAGGTVAAVDHHPKHYPDAKIPYRVALDAGRVVLAHRDEHWLIRDLDLQDPGPRQAADGTNTLNKFVRRPKGGAWEMVDHGTRKVRPCQAPCSEDEEDSD